MERIETALDIYDFYNDKNMHNIFEPQLFEQIKQTFTETEWIITFPVNNGFSMFNAILHQIYFYYFDDIENDSNIIFNNIFDGIVKGLKEYFYYVSVNVYACDIGNNVHCIFRDELLNLKTLKKKIKKCVIENYMPPEFLGFISQHLCINILLLQHLPNRPVNQFMCTYYHVKNNKNVFGYPTVILLLHNKHYISINTLSYKIRTNKINEIINNTQIISNGLYFGQWTTS